MNTTKPHAVFAFKGVSSDANLMLLAKEEAYAIAEMLNRPPTPKDVLIASRMLHMMTK
jgi:hypothetical protein